MGKSGDFLNFFGYRIHKPMFFVSLIHYALLLIYSMVDGGMFTFDNLELASPIPTDVEMIPLYVVLTNVLSYFIIFAFYQLLYKIIYAFREKDKDKLFNFFIPFVGLFVFYLINLANSWPGMYNIDDNVTYGLARFYLPYYWQSYLTSLFYMVGLWVMPFESGQIVFLDVIIAFLFAYFYYRLSRLVAGKKFRWFKLLLIAFAVSPWVNSIALHNVRPYIYSVLNLAVFGYLLFEKLQGKQLNVVKLGMLALGFAALAFWRSESIVYLLIAPFLLYVTYADAKLKKTLIFAATTVLLYGCINIPQSIGNGKYYNNDYLIVSTTRALSVLLNLDETYNYDGIEEDIQKIDKVVDVEQIKGLPFVSTSYQNSNSIRNFNRLSETMSTKEAQQEYIGAFLNIISNNKELFLKERLDLFLETNLLKEHIQIDFGKDLYDTVERVYTYYWVFEDYLIQNEWAPDRMETGVWYEAVTQRTPEAAMLYAIFPYLFIIIAVFIVAIFKKAWQIFWIQLAMLLREGVIFLTSPDAMIVYYMPDITLCVFIGVLLIVFGLSNIGAEQKVRLLAGKQEKQALDKAKAPDAP